MFLFNATATTDIYPDWHTLPLHDALPIWKERLSPRALVIRRPLSEACCTTRLPRTATPLIGGAGTSSLSTVAARARAGRSEEHTSELQSLMRISYAVFCLKKKNHTMTQSYKS